MRGIHNIAPRRIVAGRQDDVPISGVYAGVFNAGGEVRVRVCNLELTIADDLRTPETLVRLCAGALRLFKNRKLDGVVRRHVWCRLLEHAALVVGTDEIVKDKHVRVHVGSDCLRELLDSFGALPDKPMRHREVAVHV